MARRLTPMAWAAYCSRDYAERRGCPSSVDALCRHAVIGAEGPIATLPGWTWLREAAPAAEVVARSSSLTNLISAVKAGLGVTVLPCFLANSDADLVRCIGPITGVQSDLWLLTREDARDVRRVRAFIAFVAAHVAAMRRLLGKRDPGGRGFNSRPPKPLSGFHPIAPPAAVGLVASPLGETARYHSPVTPPSRRSSCKADL